MKGMLQVLPKDGIEIGVAGVTFENRQDLIDPSIVGSEVFLLRDKSNGYDENAIRVLRHDGACIGFVPKRYSRHLAPFAEYQDLSGVVVAVVVGGTPDKRIRGVRLWVWDDMGRPLPKYAMSAEVGGYE